jgi:hypothetical protein
MKRTIFTSLLLVICLSANSLIFAQNTASKWEPVFITVSGGNYLDGVDVYFKTDICNTESVVFIKFINNNDYAVKLSWFDAVFTNEGNWIHKDTPTEQRTISLTAKSEKAGDCASSYPQLIIKLKDFIDQVDHFKRFSTSKLTISVD